jgi:hypothetical protein
VEKGGILLVQMISTWLHGARKGGGGRHPVVSIPLLLVRCETLIYFVVIPSRFKVSVLSCNMREIKETVVCDNYPFLIVHRSGLQLGSLLAGEGGGRREGLGGRGRGKRGWGGEEGGGEEGAVFFQPI